MKHWLHEHRHSILLSILLTLLPMVIGLIIWNRLPDTMAVHWGADGAADGFGPKAFAVFGLPCLLAAVEVLCLLITAADKRQHQQNRKAMRLIFWIMPLCSLWVSCMLYAVSLGMTLKVIALVPLLMGVMFILLGNYMPKVKQNATLGIKIHWTLSNEENWNKTHRFTGKVWVCGGIALLFSTLLPYRWIIWVMLGAILVLVAMPVAYSYHLYRLHRAQGVAYTVPPRTKGQKIALLISAVLVTVILAGVAVLMFTGDITYTCGDDALRIEATYSAGSTVRYETIDDVQLLENFDIGMRMMGFYSARLATGSFQNEDLGYYTLYAYPACNSMILLHSGEKHLAFNAATPAETQQLYATLLEKTAP